MKRTLRLNTDKIIKTLLIAAFSSPLGLIAQEPLADGIYSGASYTVVQQPKPNKSISQNAKSISDSTRLRIADARQNAGFPIVYQLSVYPNPAISDARVVFSARENGLPYQLYMVSADGKPMWQQKGSTLNGVNTITINVNSYPAGIYYFQLMIGNNRQVIRLAKVK